MCMGVELLYIFILDLGFQTCFATSTCGCWDAKQSVRSLSIPLLPIPGAYIVVTVRMSVATGVDVVYGTKVATAVDVVYGTRVATAVDVVYGTRVATAMRVPRESYRTVLRPMLLLIHDFRRHFEKGGAVCLRTPSAGVPSGVLYGALRQYICLD